MVVVLPWRGVVWQGRPPLRLPSAHDDVADEEEEANINIKKNI